MKTPYFETEYNDPFLMSFEGQTDWEESDFEGDEYSDLFGIGKHAKAKRAARIEKRKIKNDILRAKAEGIRNGTFQPGSGFANVMNGVLSGAKSLLGGGNSASAEQTETLSPETGETPDPTNPDKKNTLIWVGLVVLILFAVYFFVIRPKMKK